MTGKSLQGIVNGLVDTVVERRGLNPALGVKGGEREIANALVGMAIKDFSSQILGHAGAATPTNETASGPASGPAPADTDAAS